MSRSDRSLARRTLVHVAVLVGGSALLVAILSLALIAVARAILPPRAEAAGEEARPSSTGKLAAGAEEARPARGARRDPEAEPAEEGEAARPARTTPESESWPKCCDTLRELSRTAPPGQRGAYSAALGACNGLAGSPQARQVIQHMLEGRDLPEACQ